MVNFLNKFVYSALLLIIGLLMVSSAYAAEGATSHYTPGFYGDFWVAVTPDPGFYLRNDFYFYGVSREKSRVVQSGRIESNLRYKATVYMPTGLMVTNKKIFGARYAFGAFLPIMRSDMNANVILGSTSAPIKGNLTSVGDLGLIPASLFWNINNFHINTYGIITAPIGSYKKGRTVNTGLNYWSFEPVLAGTYLHPTLGYEVSAVLGYIFNAKNPATDYKTGQEFHADYMLNKFFSDTFALGLHGFFYQQTTGDSGSGALLGAFEGESAGIGPALMWIPKIKGGNLTISTKWLHEYYAKRRLKGDGVFLSFILKA